MALEKRPAANHRRLARRPVLNDPIQLIGPASPFGNSRETFLKSGTDGSNPVPSSGESGTNRTPSLRGRRSIHRLDRYRRDTVDGVVQQLAVHPLGGVVTPAEPLLVIVPVGSHLEGAVKLNLGRGRQSVAGTRVTKPRDGRVPRLDHESRPSPFLLFAVLCRCSIGQWLGPSFSGSATCLRRARALPRFDDDPGDRFRGLRGQLPSP